MSSWAGVGYKATVSTPEIAVGTTAVEVGLSVIQQEAAALMQLSHMIDDSFEQAVQLLLQTQQRVILTGIGKSGHIARKVAATLAATGTPAFFVHPAEAAHGDLGMIVRGDTLLAFSNSGTTRELTAIVGHARKQGIPVIGVASRAESPLAVQADVHLPLPRLPEACPVQIAPTTSTTMMIALGDALAIAVMKLRGFQQDDMAPLHPGGNIGRSLVPVGRLIASDAVMPLARADMNMRSVVIEMTAGGKGVAGVIDARGELIGIITDGDLRRNFDRLAFATAGDIMTRDPITISGATPVKDAYKALNDAKITVAFVVPHDADRRPIGIVHIHDLAIGA